MSLQTNLTSRRQFLERSMWGFGSTFLLPSLLQSCIQDHNIPPLTDPPLVDFEINWNDTAKTVVTTGLEMIPGAGEILGPLADILWPSDKTDVWGEIKEQVEALIDQKIADDVYQTVSDDLSGLNNVLTRYRNELNSGTKAEKLSQWQSTLNFFVDALPHFQSNGKAGDFRVPLLPLFAQFTNLYLAVLRDGVIDGVAWGRTIDNHNQDIIDLQKAISDSISYTISTWSTGRDTLQGKTRSDNHRCEPFRTVNQYDREMSQTVLYFYDTWNYFDVTKFPNGAKNPDGTTLFYKREIFSDPYGTCDNSGDIYPLLQKTPGTQLPVSINVWAGNRIQSVAVTYPANSGPDGLTTTKRGATGGNPTTFAIAPNNPIVGARVGSGDIVNALQFQYHDGTTTAQVASGGGDSGWLGYPDQALSSIHINGVSDYYDSADCVVFGFQAWTSPSSTLNAIQTIYVKSPMERSAADLAKSFPNLAITEALISTDLKAKRKAYWEALAARAKALK